MRLLDRTQHTCGQPSRLRSLASRLLLLALTPATPADAAPAAAAATGHARGHRALRDERARRHDGDDRQQRQRQQRRRRPDRRHEWGAVRRRDRLQLGVPLADCIRRRRPERVVQVPDNSALEPVNDDFTIEIRFRFTDKFGNMAQKGQSRHPAVSGRSRCRAASRRACSRDLPARSPPGAVRRWTTVSGTP